jgi:hypothetical protein
MTKAPSREALLIIGIIAAVLAQAAPADRADRTYEGDWYVSDDTDNNTGERNVYAFHTYLKQDDPEFVTLTMRCTEGKPTFFVDWDKGEFLDQTVLTIGPVAHPDAEPAEDQYVFGKFKDELTIDRGLRASPATSAKIITAIGQAKYMTLTAHLASGARSVGVDVDGTQRAWSRVSRHCPVRKMQRPPL